jgi:hypothetical protein
MNFYEFHLNQMKNLLISQKEQITTLKNKVKEDKKIINQDQEFISQLKSDKERLVRINGQSEQEVQL